MSGYWPPSAPGLDPDDYIDGQVPVKNDTTGLFEPGTGGGGVSVHNDLSGRDTADAHPIAAITGLQAALDAAAAGGLVPVDVGTPVTTVSADGTVDVTFASVWGVDADGSYYDIGGAASGEAAALFLDSTTGELVTIALETR